ncbi:thioredoxin family protein [Bacillus suaedaesalsae]|uniref:Thioredoxin family protein n=1 Tax=Bacillus suaedaesalsae TaxID=2810349 RepID=A0ABS2DG50_9BACI|nr:thioredoxin family protein [Bacillus suaedaesalsae]MBM6617429.1 thioredoxin family protein [Bacillus suaedaesalsae]
MTLVKWFEKGVPFKQYVDNMKVNKEELLNVYENLEFHRDDIIFFQKKLLNKWKGIVLTADWCGDAALCVPVLQRISEISNVELHYLIRDENLKLMDQYLTNGTSRAIPIFIFMDQDGNEKLVWGPRSKEVQQMVESGRATLPPTDAPDFQEKQLQFYKEFKEKTTSDPEIWRTVIESVKEKL